MDIYTLNLTGLLALCTGLFLTQRQPSSSPFPSPSSKPKSKSNPLQSHPQLPFFLVYALVMSSDWLQGPFLYSLYHDEHRLPASFVSTLFTTGFLSGAISGSLIGRLADRHGRKSACLAFCAVYALSCVLTTVPDKAVLFLGRVLGGVGTSLLFSVFESWMVSDFRARALGGRGVDLSRTFGLMSTVNSVVAIACGVGSEWLVGWAGTRKAPFWASVVCCGLAGVVIWASWVSLVSDVVHFCLFTGIRFSFLYPAGSGYLLFYFRYLPPFLLPLYLDPAFTFPYTRNTLFPLLLSSLSRRSH